MNYGFHLRTGGEATETREGSARAIIRTEKLEQLHTQLAKDLEFLAAKSACHYDKRRSEGPDLKEGEPVYLIQRNVKTKRPTSKLDFTKLEPFQVEKKIGKVNYRLKLLKEMKIHPVFHISLLEPAPATAGTTTVEVEPDQEYEVKEVLADRQENGRRIYLIKWTGYDKSENS